MSWTELQAIVDDAEAEALRDDPPVACPNDGEPLESGQDNVLHCPFDGWIWDGLTTV